MSVCVWVEIHVRGSDSLLAGNHGLARDCDIRITENCFKILRITFKCTSLSCN